MMPADQSFVLELAIQKFGPVNQRRSNEEEARFGRKGSKSVRLNTGEWYDHEEGKGGVLQSTSRPWSRPPNSRTHQPKLPTEPVSIEGTNARACEIWRGTTCLTPGCPSSLYLEGRDICLSPWPETFAAARLSPWVGNDKRKRPALVVARHCPFSGFVRGIQAVFLTEDGRKAPIEAPKQSLGTGSLRAQLIWAFPLVDLIIAEGVESALSAHLIYGLPSWAMCGGFPEAILLPSSCRRVLLFADHDRKDISQQRARRLARWLTSNGREARVVAAEEVGADANDLLRRDRHG